jgi:uncharacterized protein YciI
LFPAHLERLHQFQAGGSLLNSGTLGDPQEDGSMSIFSAGQPPRTSSAATRSSIAASCGAGGSAREPT